MPKNHRKVYYNAHIHVVTTQDVKEACEEAAEELEISLSVFIRRAIKEYIAKHTKRGDGNEVNHS